MKKLKSLFFVGLTLSSVLFYTSCSPDEGIVDDIVDMTAPSVSFVSQDPTGLFVGEYPTSDFEVSADEENVYVAMEAIAGSSDLKTLTVELDGVQLDPSQFTVRDLISSSAISSNNPLLILGDNVNAFTLELGIENDGSATSKTLTLTVEAEDGLQESVSISFNSFALIENSIDGVLLNSAGPAGQGGLDLDTGEGTGTVDSDATAILGEIKDEGIDINLPNDENWKAQISGMNGAEIRSLSSSVESFDFESVTRMDELETYFTNGDALPNTNDDGEATSNAVVVGDVFLVNRDSKIYLIEVTDVIATTDNNNDAIEFRIKH